MLISLQKNIFVTENNKIKIVDFENVVRFDPAFDLGYLLSNWILELSKDNKTQIEKFLVGFEKEYKKNFSTKESGEILIRTSKYIGAMMLHRLVGVKNTNRLDYYNDRPIDLIKLAGVFIQSQDIPSSILKTIKFEEYLKQVFSKNNR